MSNTFQFKQFAIDQTGCDMKINTDGVLLGALAHKNNPGSILDIGTGTGVIALMLAQRFPLAFIDGIEIDESAVGTAQLNFTNSPYPDRLSLYSGHFEVYFAERPSTKYDLIVSNPPFYINSLHSPGAGKKLAKHADADFFEKLMASAAEHLNTDGSFWLVLPLDTADLVKQIAATRNLYLKHIIHILSYPDSIPHRQILAFGLKPAETTETNFVIYDELKKYSDQYKIALKDFFTIF